MTENDETVIKPEGGSIEGIEGGIAIIPKTDKRPMAIVGMGTSNEELDKVKQLSDRLGQVGMEHVVLTVEDAEKEGITRDDLVSAQLEQAQTDGLLEENPIFNSPNRGGNTNMTKKIKRKKKGKKTHRKKR